ncbi:diguanylate cyclase/phosphodiesterase [Roseibium sp. TrichSKD4]|uniref:putative bifunctional diguanylate cyclase/phosphodiesterase n=1 Tax=Roseibium sp. TrichSKD4 TaxID=744980 RepID=UPI0001E56B7D|nr:GGDEF domain-containing phosphodiesterase [Roseibium sp. TrichSKD4]EFO30723.1 diguanylate cyclase/phosphodiesterase [Roseibium sp. TrichSKD4]
MRTQLGKTLRGALDRVFVRATVFSVFGMLVFTLALIGINYTSQASKIKERFERFAEQKAESVARVAAVDIHARRSDDVELLLNAVSDDLVIAAKAYTLSGREFASDKKSSSPLARIVINPDAALAASSGDVQTRVSESFLDYIVPARVKSRIVGSVLVRISRSDFLTLQKDVRDQVIVTLILVFALFVPIIAGLMHRATAGISEITLAAKTAADGHLNVEGLLSAEPRGEVGQLQTVFRKMISNMREGLQEIQRLVYSDGITGLPNRTWLEKFAGEYTSQKDNADGLLLFAGLDKFKLINDMHGYRVGDAVLKQLARRFKVAIEELSNYYKTTAPFVARFAGDEFVAFIPGQFTDEDIEAFAQELVDRMGRSVRVEQLLFSISMSVGCVRSEGKGEPFSDTLQNGNLAMHKAKSSGRARFVCYSSQLRDEIVQREFMETRLRQALEIGALSVHYQPKVDMVEHRIVGAEALVRWQDPELGSVSPVHFVPIAEETGLIFQIGEFVMKRALEDIGQVRELGYDLSVAVNISPQQLYSPSFTDRVLGVIGESGFPTDRLELEVTESSLVDYSQNIMNKIIPIKDEGVSFAIDDFGTGYSCLNSLAGMPFNTLKIDRSFISDLANSEGRRRIVELILLMANQLHMETVSEGIETELQAECIQAWGGRYAQGFLWSKPVPIEDFRLLLANGNLFNSMEKKPISPLH